MSDAIKHECGLAFIRLRKPFSHFHKQYGTPFYGINKMYLLMEKQHNRGQDGAGFVSIKLDAEAGQPYMRRIRSNANQPIADIMKQIQTEIKGVEKHYPDLQKHPGMCKGYLSFMGEVLMGHLRYGTQGRNNIEYCHPFVKGNTNPNKHLTMAGNFNLVNTKELVAKLNLSAEANNKCDSDLEAMIETVAVELDKDATQNPSNRNWKKILENASAQFDGGFVAGGLCGNGDAFVMRDKNGIRPCYYYVHEDVIAAASERPALMTAFNATENDVVELPRGHALIVASNGNYTVERILPEAENFACSFERIYFSRGSDLDIYKERKQLGRNLSEDVLKAIDYDLKNTIFTFIPNTAETAFYGLIKGAEAYLNEIKIQRIQSWNKDFSDEQLAEMINRRVRVEKIAIKDVKMRTFITDDSSRNEMVQHVYDVTYGTVRAGIDSLVIIDDSVVRGTTLRESIIRMLDRLGPKKIIIVSSSPQIRYPDCYGIDMSKMGEFIAFQAAIELLNNTGKAHIIEETYQQCLQANQNNTLAERNFVKDIYASFTDKEISAQIGRMLRAKDVKADVKIIYQTLEGLHSACPNNPGDWYFTGNYPTKGGNEVVNRAFINYMEGVGSRGY
jgi:amidophosphoribosyltransferase